MPTSSSLAARRGKRRAASILLVALVLLVAACGSRAEPTPGGPTIAPDALRVVATTTILADLVRQVGGSAVNVESLVPKGGEVHTFDPTPTDVRRVSQAKLIVANGLGLDDWLTTLASDAGTGAPVVRLGEGLAGVTYLDGTSGSIVNPHLWMNVAYASLYVDRIESTLAAMDPAHASAFHAAASAYRATLATLDTQVRARIGALPAADRVVVSFHDAFPYFASAYGLTVVGSIVDAPGQDPSAGTIADLVAKIWSSGAKAIFAEAQFSPKLADTIAGETGVTVVTDLYTDSLGDAPADTYVNLIRYDVDRVIQALGGGQATTPGAAPSPGSRTRVPPAVGTISRTTGETIGTRDASKRHLTIAGSRHEPASREPPAAALSVLDDGDGPMRVGAPTLVALGAIAVLVALGVTDQVLPAADPHLGQVRPWIAARALGVTAYLLLAVEVASGLILSHPRNAAAWRLTKPAYPWHEMISVFTGAFLTLHIALLAIDPYAKVGVLGAFVPGFSEYRPAAVAVGSVALYALVFTAVTAKWTRLLPSGWWLKVHRFTAVIFLMTWVHAVLAGTDGGALTPLYVATGLPILAGVAHRWWTAKARPQRLTAAAGPSSTNAPPVRLTPVAAVLEDQQRVS